MSDYGIKPEWKEAWKFTDKFCPGEGETHSCALVNFAVHLLAGWMRERFNHEHDVTYLDNGRGQFTEPYCAECGRKNFDPRHKFTADDWLRAAREELGK